jgi:transketolase
VRDISALGAVPHLVLAEPCLEAELEEIFALLVGGVSESAYLRLVSVKWPMPFTYPAGLRASVGKGWVVRDGNDLAVFGYGPWLLANAYEAASQLEEKLGVGIRIINLPWLNRVDAAWLASAVAGCRLVMTLDNHYVHGGQGEMLTAAMAELGLEPAVRITRVGVTTLPQCGTNDEVLAYHGLDVSGLVAHFQRALEGRARRLAPQIA